MGSCCGGNNFKLPKKKTQNTKPQIISKPKRIIQGWTNLITRKYKDTPFVKERARICNDCVHISRNNSFCKICGCYIPAKITVKKEKCPFNFWLSEK